MPTATYFDPQPPTPTSRIEHDLTVLRDHAREFARLTPRERAGLLRDCLPRLMDVSRAWVETAVRAKGLDIHGPNASEEWLAGPVTTARNARLLIESLDQIQTTGKPFLPDGAFHTSRSGRTEVDVFPGNAAEKVMFAGFSARVRMLDGHPPARVREQQAAFYSRRDPEGGVSLVLGAGNVNSIPPMDALYKMFVDGNVCIVKMNPVNEYVGAFMEQAFRPLVDRGYLRVVYGGGDVGSLLCYHEAVSDVHITGSDLTHDLIVWGPEGAERNRRKSANDPILKKPITSELGCITPVVVVPGPYTHAQLQFIAENVATQVANNASFNCNAAKMLVLSKRWPQREAFLSRIREILGSIAPRHAYYPGAHDRYERLLKGKNVVSVGQATDDALAWAFVPSLDPNAEHEPLFEHEPWCAIVSEATLDEGDPAAFIAAAVKFCDDRLWGTLSMSIIIHPETEKNPLAARALEDGIDALQYGAIVVNHWPGVVYGLVRMPWGGHASATLDDIQSGMGWVHNSYMLDGCEKSIVRGPLVVAPKPPWFVTNRNAHVVAQRMLSYEAHPSWFKIPGIAAASLKG